VQLFPDHLPESNVFQLQMGGCLCGAVRYRITGEPLARSLCHCPSCRLAAGASPVAWAVVPGAEFSVAMGEPKRYESSPGVERTFCAMCGSALTYRELDNTKTIDVAAATLDDQSWFTPDREIWVRYRPHWLPALAGVAQYASDTGQDANDNV
jgi:hypothetical protein